MNGSKKYIFYKNKNKFPFTILLSSKKKKKKDKKIEHDNYYFFLNKLLRLRDQ